MEKSRISIYNHRRISLGFLALASSLVSFNTIDQVHPASKLVNASVALNNNCVVKPVKANPSETNTVNSPTPITTVNPNQFNINGLAININGNLPSSSSGSSVEIKSTTTVNSPTPSPIIESPIILNQNNLSSVPITSQTTNPTEIKPTVNQFTNLAECNVDPSLYHGNIWTNYQLEVVKSLQPIYESVGNQYNLPWQLLAAIQARETAMNLYNPVDLGGLFQITGANYQPTNQLNDLEILQQCQNVASLIDNVYLKRAGVQGNLLQNNSFNLIDIANILYAYNGQNQAYAQQAVNEGYTNSEQFFMGSPYVVNGIASYANSSINPNWHQIITDGGGLEPATSEPGALLYFYDLYQLSTNGYKMNMTGMPTNVQY